jgi:hypothetical protein
MNKDNRNRLKELVKDADFQSFQLGLKRVRCSTCHQPYTVRGLWSDDGGYMKRHTSVRGPRTNRMTRTTSARFGPYCPAWRIGRYFEQTRGNYVNVHTFICECDCGSARIIEQGTNKLLGRE